MIKINVYALPTVVSTLLVLASSIFATEAQEVSIPDPELNAAVREALQKPTGPITQQDKHIVPMDECGVALAAIQRLDRKLEEKNVFINVKEKGLSESKHRSQTS